MWIHSPNNTTHRTDDVCPQHGHDQHAHGRSKILCEIVRGDVPVADAREGHDGPVQRHQVYVAGQRRLAVGVLLPLHHEPVGLGVALQRDAAPHAGHPVADNQQQGHKLPQRQHRETHGVYRVQPVEDPLDPRQPQEAHQPEQADDLQGPHAVAASHVVPRDDAIHVHGHDGREVDPKPTGEVHRGDLPRVSYLLLMVVVLDHEELKNHIKKETKVDEPIKNEQPVQPGHQEGCLVGREHCDEDQQRCQVQVPHT
mmetsp:Transcript_104711/g.292174  ORF Transcript_104711/g.292174 Transcript_104711/m.292174 type:complete len:255 (+) Transcript_104711:895-1659(+)